MEVIDKALHIMKIIVNKQPQARQNSSKTQKVGVVRFIEPKPGEFDAVLKSILPGMRSTIEFLKDK